MQTIEKQEYNIFTALIDNIQKKNRKKLRFARCQECGRSNPYRLISVDGYRIKCKKCGNNISIKSE